MALNIDLVNGAINVYETGQIPRTYFGAIGASGKFYVSGISTAATTPFDSGYYYTISNTLSDCIDGFYSGELQSSTSGNGYGALLNFQISGGSIDYVSNGSPSAIEGSGSGYAVGDTMTIDGANYGGTGSCVIRVDKLGVNGLLVVIGGDDYQVKWTDLIVNGTSPVSLQDAQSLLAILFSSVGKSYKVYSAILSQTDTNPPSAIVLENTLGFTPTWEYIENGGYGFDFPSTPDPNKIAFFGCPVQTPYSLVRNDTRNVMLYYSEGDGNMSNLNIEVRVYN